jgi:hypothetical protein
VTKHIPLPRRPVTDLLSELETPVPSSIPTSRATLIRAARCAAEHQPACVRTSRRTSPATRRRTAQARRRGLTCATPTGGGHERSRGRHPGRIPASRAAACAASFAALPEHVRLTVALDSANAVDDLRPRRAADARSQACRADLDASRRSSCRGRCGSLARRVRDSAPLARGRVLSAIREPSIRGSKNRLVAPGAGDALSTFGMRLAPRR